MNTKEIQTCILGDTGKECSLFLIGVGKSSIIYRFVKNDFKENVDSTMGAAFMSKLVETGGTSIKFQVISSIDSR